MTGTGKQFPRSTLRSNLVRILPKQVKEEVRLKSHEYSTFESIRDFVLKLADFDKEDQERANRRVTFAEDFKAKARKEAQEELMATWEEEDPIWMTNAWGNGQGGGEEDEG